MFTLCQFVMDNSNNAALVSFKHFPILIEYESMITVQHFTINSKVGATLDTLLKFLNWIPLGYIFETKLIQTLILKFLTVPMFRSGFIIKLSYH